MSDRPKVLVICSIPPRRPHDLGASWADLYEGTIGPTHRKYCEQHGYEYHLDVSDIWEQVRPTKRNSQIGESVPIKYKIKFLLFQHFLNPDSCKKEYDAVVWLDADLLITNYDIPLEKFLNSRMGTDEEDENPGDIILSRDPNGLHATVIMMRRTALTLGFAYACGEAGMRYWMEDDWSDQMAMRMFLATPPYNWLVHYHSIKALCAMYPGIYTNIPERIRKHYEWAPGDFALHLSALSIERRIEIAKKVVEEQALL